eukprot:349738-Chlamydomonas_euryale.AAC.5
MSAVHLTAHLKALIAVVKEALIEQCQQRVQDGRVSLWGGGVERGVGAWHACLAWAGVWSVASVHSALGI